MREDFGLGELELNIMFFEDQAQYRTQIKSYIYIFFFLITHHFDENAFIQYLYSC